MSRLVALIVADDPAVRNTALDHVCAPLSVPELLAEAAALEHFRHMSPSLYERVRACFFLYALHRFHLPSHPGLPPGGHLPFEGYEHLLERRFEEAIALFLRTQAIDGPSDGVSSALAAAYHRLAFQTLADQVRRSVRAARGNQWMFRVGHPEDQPLRLRPELLRRGDGGAFPVLCERTPVRMDLTHSAWSDIFFLGMDYPDGARVLNVSVDLAVRGRDETPRPPVEAYLRALDEPVLRLTSVDLGTTAEIRSLDEVFDFARDYLGLLKAALIASGIVPPGIEGSGESLAQLLARVVGPGQGLELVSCVNGIPKGSRLAVSTNLLAALIAACMRATHQTGALTGPLTELERRIVAARAILGEWLAGSGGGWQDSGGVWPGIKLIEGQSAGENDPEHGISRGRLLPRHTILGRSPDADLPFATDATRDALQRSLVVVHGGMAQNVGPILEMVTEKYLLRTDDAWRARLAAQGYLDAILGHLATGDIAAIGRVTTENFTGPIQTIIPWASNLYTENVIAAIQTQLGADFWGFWMLGGMAGGGMGFIVAPHRKAEAQDRLQAILSGEKRRLEHALPFAMEPVVYDFALNDQGTVGALAEGESAPLPAAYYAQCAPALVQADPRSLSASRRADLTALAAASRRRPEFAHLAQTLFDRLMPAEPSGAKSDTLAALLVQNGFDPAQHERIRQDLVDGRIGLAQNRLPVSAEIRDVRSGDVIDALGGLPERYAARGRQALADGEVAVVTLAAGVGSRWTQGAGVVKALHPFARLAGKHRTFVETHLAKSRRRGQFAGTAIPHIVTTSYMTHRAVADYLTAEGDYGYTGPLHLSPGQSIGLRLVPTERDLRYSWEETSQQILDERQQKMRESGRAALIAWAQQTGEGTDYADPSAPQQSLHPVGHWYEVPNLLKNGLLASLLRDRPQLQYLMVHNIDTLGADLDPAMVGLFAERDGDGMMVEVIPRRLEDRGGGLARVDGRLRLVEGLAMPREKAEFGLTYYNSATTWVRIDHLLTAFGLTRATLSDPERVQSGIRSVAARMPTYVTLKDVKRRWGAGQEDVLPVTQFEKLWGDMTALTDWQTAFVAVPRSRGQQLKEQAQLDGWLRDGSAHAIEQLCDWG
jgi:hypothetical protein